MAHTLQERYSPLVDAKLRDVLVKKDGVIFNNRYEGDPKAGAVKVPVRDAEVTIGDYDKDAGATATTGSTTYKTINIDKDKAINEIIDGYDAAAVPDNLVADRLDSGAYSIAYQMEKDASAILENSSNHTTFGTTEALTADTIYGSLVDCRTTMSKAKIPNDGRRWCLMSPDTYALALKSDQFIHATDLGDKVIATGALGKIAGFLVFEDNTLAATTEFICGHPDWCTRVNEWAVPVHLQDINGSGTFIGASAVQGRKIYAHAVTKKNAVYLKKHA